MVAKPELSIRISVLLSVALAIAGFGHAQSGRKQGKRAPIRPIQETTSRSVTQWPRGIFHQTGGSFQIVFARTYPGKLKYSKKEQENLDYSKLRHQRLDSFVRELNLSGRLGYRLASVINGWDPVALMQPTEHQYEYAWFETIGRSKFEKPGFEEQRAEFAGKGYRIAANVPVEGDCASVDNYDGTIAYLECKYTDLFLVERRMDKQLPVHQRLVSFVRKPGSRPSLEISDEINRLLEGGYYPVSLLSQLEVLLEKSPAPNSDLPTNTKVRLVRGDSRRELMKRVQQLGNEGFRIAMANNGVALMLKGEGTPDSYTYHWVEAAERSFMGLNIKGKDPIPEIATLQETGAVFRITYPDFMRSHCVLIFEQMREARVKRGEYRIYDIEFEATEDVSKFEISRDLAKATSSAMDTVDRLVREGFEIRDLFVSGKVKIILERKAAN